MRHQDMEAEKRVRRGTRNEDKDEDPGADGTKFLGFTLHRRRTSAEYIRLRGCRIWLSSEGHQIQGREHSAIGRLRVLSSKPTLA
jgi:hypothetical protein